MRRWPSDRRTDRYNWELASGPISAFGESKPLRVWAADERSAVNREALRTRLALGWAPEQAITTARHERPDMVFTHNGRTLTLRGWADQTGIKYHTLYNRITKPGMSFTGALDKGAEGADFDLPVTAFGETKTLHHWAVDPRARCTVSSMRRRLTQGWNPQQAITEEPAQRSALGSGVPHHAFGMRWAWRTGGATRRSRLATCATRWSSTTCRWKPCSPASAGPPSAARPRRGISYTSLPKTSGPATPSSP
ncbi:hypothetical protein GCM10010095_61260 [Streptomyces anthocyanicus]|nr:hypothetical protein GCM10010095_61260 [Streptomyces anthocyanicus]